MGNVESSKRNNGFDWYSTADQVARDISLAGKNVIVTGANTGIGKESARVLAKMGANVFLGCRSASRGKQALADLQAAVPQGKFTLMELDLGSLKSVKKFVEEFDTFDLPLHVLLNNAGVMACPYEETEDGFEMQFGTNHLGHFYLTHLLLPRLKQAATPTSAARVVNVSSAAHRFGDINFADLKGKNTWNNSFVGRWKAYGQSKTANILFSYELNERMKSEGTNIISVALHPGSINTELSRHIPGAPTGGRFISSLVTLFKTIPQGAATSVYCCSAPELEKGSRNWIYFSDSNEAVPLAYALNPENAKKLWELSEQLTGLAVSH